MQSPHDISQMMIYAETVWSACYLEDEISQIALAWLIKNRVLSAYYHQSVILGQGDKMGPKIDNMLALICRKMIAKDLKHERNFSIHHGDFSDQAFCRLFANICHVWNSDHEDPTHGALRFHRHDEFPQWAQSAKPLALIGSRFFYH